MNRRTIEIVTFDASGTLILPAPSVGGVYSEVLSEFGIMSDPATIELHFKSAFKEIKQKPQRILDQACWKAIVKASLPEVPHERFDAVFQRLWETFGTAERWALLPGAYDTLSQLKTKGYRLAVITNNDNRLLNVFKGLGLSPFFEQIFISADIGFEKPDKRIFEYASQTLNTWGERILHIGDSKVEDFDGATGAGWQAGLLGQNLIDISDTFKLLN